MGCVCVCIIIYLEKRLCNRVGIKANRTLWFMAWERERWCVCHVCFRARWINWSRRPTWRWWSALIHGENSLWRPWPSAQVCHHTEFISLTRENITRLSHSAAWIIHRNVSVLSSSTVHHLFYFLLHRKAHIHWVKNNPCFIKQMIHLKNRENLCFNKVSSIFFKSQFTYLFQFYLYGKSVFTLLQSSFTENTENLAVYCR